MRFNNLNISTFARVFFRVLMIAAVAWAASGFERSTHYAWFFGCIAIVIADVLCYFRSGDERR